MISPRVFTGGDLATNGYVLEGKEGAICFDAPEGMARELMRTGTKPVALLLTHGHFDHMWDAALIQEDHHCPVYVHPADAPMVLDTSYVKMFGVATPSALARRGGKFRHSRPGHAPASSARARNSSSSTSRATRPAAWSFYHPGWGVLISGDTLFCGGVGRWDLPGGSRSALLQGLRKHLVPLPPETRVYAGHGPSTTIGHELETNPYLDVL